MKIAVEVCYTISSHAIIDLPEGKTWDDVEDHYIKWGTLYLRFAGDGEDAFTEFDCDEPSFDSVEWKRPDLYRIWETTGDANTLRTDYEKLLTEVNP